MDRKHTPFTSLSRRKRRAATLKIKTLIYRKRDTWGGAFYDECDHDQSVASNQAWSDIVFLGRDPAVFWNAEIITANVAFADAVEGAAFNEAMSRIVEVNALDRSVIEAAISDFRARGECNWVSGIPACVRYSGEIPCKPFNMTK